MTYDKRLELRIDAKIEEGLKKAALKDKRGRKAAQIAREMLDSGLRIVRKSK